MMKFVRRTGLTALAGLALLSVPASAQVCVGHPPLGPANIGAGVGFFDGGKSYSGSGTIGDRTWASAGFGYTDYDDTTLALKGVGVTLGHSVDASPGSQLSVCPIAAAEYDFGLEVAGVDFTQWVLSGGMALGLRTEVSPTVSVIPGVAGRFVYVSINADAGPIGEASESDTYGILSAGLGFLFNDRLSITPSVNVPVGIDGDTTFSLGMGIAVGR